MSRRVPPANSNRRERLQTAVIAATVSESLLYISGLPQKLVADRWAVHIVCSPGAPLDKFEAIPGVTTHRLPMQRNPSIWQDAVALIRWIRLLRIVRPLVVSIGTPKASLLGLLAAALTNVPNRRYLLYGLRLETSTGARRSFLWAIEWLTMRLSTKVYSVSESLCAEAVALRLVPAAKIAVIGSGSANGVDTKHFRPNTFGPRQLQECRAAIGLRKGLPTVGFVGRITRDKGLHDLASAVEQLAAENVSCQLLIVGREDDPSGTAALRRLRATGVPIVVTGFIDDPARYYHLMDVLCLPSYREGFPTVVLEASASEVPVIVSTATGATDSIRDGETGFSHNVSDVAMLAAKLKLILSDPVLAKSLGENGRRWVSSSFEIDLVQGEILSECYTPLRRQLVANAED